MAYQSPDVCVATSPRPGRAYPRSAAEIEPRDVPDDRLDETRRCGWIDDSEAVGHLAGRGRLTRRRRPGSRGRRSELVVAARPDHHPRQRLAALAIHCGLVGLPVIGDAGDERGAGDAAVEI